jgi:plasmid replication initiation protein
MDLKEHERIFNNHSTSLRQEYNRFNSEVKNVLNGLDDKIIETVKQELQIHVEAINQTLARIEEKVNSHFGK